LIIRYHINIEIYAVIRNPDPSPISVLDVTQGHSVIGHLWSSQWHKLSCS